MKKIGNILLFVMICNWLQAQTFTYSQEKICTEFKAIPLDSIERQFDFIQVRIIPILTYYLDTGEIHSYNELHDCSNIQSIFVKHKFYLSSKKVEVKLLYDLLQLKYFRIHSPDEWRSHYEILITSTNHILNMTFGAIDFSPIYDETEKNDYKNKMANSTISTLEDNFIYAYENCNILNRDQKDLHNNMIEKLLVYNPSIIGYLCIDD